MKILSHPCVTTLDYTIHEALREVQAIRPISLRTFYRWLDRTGMGAGRAYYTPKEVERMKAIAHEVNRNRFFLKHLEDSHAQS